MNNNRRHTIAAFKPGSARSRTKTLHSLLAFAAAIILLMAPPASAVNITASAAVAGQTPEIVGYNSGHFMPNSNTSDWWRFSGVNGARIFSTPAVVEATDDLAPWGDGVSSQASFQTRRDSLRLNPLSTTYINWPYIEGRYQNNPTTGNIINLKYAFGQLQSMNIDTLAQIGYTNASFPWDPANTAAGWADRWEQWQHFYIQAFYLAKNFDVHRFQMYNEPNGETNPALPPSEWLERLRFSSDAVQAAVADVNRIYGKSLVAEMQGPVTAGNPVQYYPTWGQPTMQSLHTNELGVVDPSFQVMQTYDYQRYGDKNLTFTGDSFGSELSNVKNLASADAGGAPMRYAISEFNVHTAADFNLTNDTLDTPLQFSRFGSILAQLANNQPDELYIFKFSQTGTNGDVKKNGTYFVDNDTAPYNIGSETKGGAVVRLFAKSFAGAKELFNVPVTSGTGSTDLRLAASHDAQQNKYNLLSANEGTAARSLTIDLSSWGIAPGARAIIQEVSADRQAEVTQIVTVPVGGVINLTQPAQSVFLVSVPKTAPTYVRSLGATDDAMVKAGTNANTNFGTSGNLFAKNDAFDPSARNVTFIKFNTGSLTNSEVQQAVLQLWGQNDGSASQVITHVYGLTGATSDNWNESTITWNTAPNLAATTSTNLTDISQNFITGEGSTAHIVGLLTGVAIARQMSIDVTDFVHDHPDQQITFLITREVRLDGENVDDALASLDIASKERGTNPGPQLFLTLSSFALPGDYDHNGTVDNNDYTVWRQNYGNTNSNADGNRNGVVDTADYIVWRRNAGHTLPGSTAGSGAEVAAIPEPSTAILICCALLALCVRPRCISRA